MSAETIADRFRQHAASRPEARAVTFLLDGNTESANLTFFEIWHKASALAARLSERVPRNGRALIVIDPGPEFVIALCACQLAGVAAIPSPPPAARLQSRSAIRFGKLVSNAAPDAILVHSSMLRKLTWFAYDQAGLWSERFIVVDSNEDSASDSLELVPDPETGAIIQYTSGSTSDPKGVFISHRNLSANLAAIETMFELDEESRVVSWLPLFHDMGLIGGVLEALWVGYELVMIDTRHFARRPLCWLEAIDRFDADVSGGADFGFQLCVDAVRQKGTLPDIDLGHWRLAFSGAEPVRRETIEAFSKTFQHVGFQRSAFYPTYGLAEATLMVTGPRPGTARPRIETLADGAEVVSCGQACPGTEVIIADADTGKQCVDGEVGEIHVAGAGVAEGYWQGPNQPIAPIVRNLTGVGRSFMPTGDLGFLKGEELYICGRKRDLIIVRGKNYFPVDIEEVAGASHGDIDPHGCAAFAITVGANEEIALACELNRSARRHANHDEIVRVIAAQIASQIGVAPFDVVLLRPANLPRTTSGKLQRGRCADMYARNVWSSYSSLRTLAPRRREARSFAASTKAERIERLEEYLCFRVGTLDRTVREIIDFDTSLHALGIDSLAMIELALWIEDEIGVTLDLDLLSEDLTISEVAAEIRTRLETNTGASETTSSEGRTLTPTLLQRQFLEANVARPEGFLEIVMMRTPRDLNVDALKGALTALTGLHDAFRMGFQVDGNDWVAQIDDASPPIALERIDAANLTRDEIAGLRKRLYEDLRSRIRLDRPPLADAVLVDRGSVGGSLLALGLHHLVVDAVSISVIVTQLNQAYINIMAGSSPVVSRGSSRFANWLVALERYADSDRFHRQQGYWQGVIGRSSSSSFQPETDADWQGTPASSLAAAPNRVLMENFVDATDRNCLFIAAMTWAWHHTTGESALPMMLEHHGRVALPGTEPQSAVGWFVCHFPLIAVAAAGAESTFEAAKSEFLSVPDNGIGFGLLSLEQRASAGPLAFVQYRGTIDSAFRPDSRFPVIGVNHESGPAMEAQKDRVDTPMIWLGASIRQGRFEWRLLYKSPLNESMATQLSVGIASYLEALADSKNRPQGQASG